jgi:putative inorganic carbon (HCO3(-)) transporter
VLAAIACLELGLLATGLGGPFPLRAAWIPLAGLFFLVAFRLPDVAWALAFLALPLSAEVRIPSLGAISLPTEPMIALALAAWLLRAVLRGGIRVPANSVHLPLGALALVSVASVVLGGYKVLGLKAWAVSGAYAAFGYLFFVCSQCESRWRQRWVLLAALAGGLMGVYGTLRVIALGVDPRSAYGAARPFFPEHGTYAAYLAMLLPVAMFEALGRQDRSRWFFASAAAAMFAGLLLSFTRAAWISILVVVPAALALWAWKHTAWKRVLVVIVAVLGLLGLLATVREGQRLFGYVGSVSSVENVSNLERVNRWIAAFEMIRQHPWLGIGYDAYGEAYASYRRKTIVTEQALVRMGVHSEPLRLLAETGLAGLAAGVWFVSAVWVAGFRAFRRLRDSSAQRLALGLLAGFATYVIHGVFNSYLGLDKVTMPFWMLVGALSALGAAPRRE